MKVEEFVPFGTNWMSNAVTEVVKQDYLKKEVIIKSLKKIASPTMKLQKNNFFANFRKSNNIQDEIAYVGKKLTKDIVESGDVNKLNEVLEGTMFKAIDKIRPIQRSVISTTSQKNYKYEYCIVLRSDESMNFACSERGCKKSKCSITYRSRIDDDFTTAENIFYLIGLGLLVKELDEVVEQGFDFSAYLPKKKVYRLPGNHILPNLDVPEFGSKEVAKTILGEYVYEVSELDNIIYNLVSDKKVPEPPKRETTFRGMKGVSETVLRIRYGEWIWSVGDASKVLIDEQVAIKRNEMYKKNASGDYAKSYQTKKNINKSTVDAMESSGFNRFFNYVEFDNDVDIKKVEEIFKEFEAFNKFLYGEYVATPETTIRFRRLGNHKATGLYYPGIDCICIDIGNPHSLVHEYGHMLDYHAGEVSISESFVHIRNEYEELLKFSIREKKIEFKGKYNLDYYLTPTEIFARCFEIYMKNKGMKNSINYQTDEFPYPTDECFVEDVKKFFDNFFKSNVIVETEEDIKKVACSL